MTSHADRRFVMLAEEIGTRSDALEESNKSSSQSRISRHSEHAIICGYEWAGDEDDGPAHEAQTG